MEEKDTSSSEADFNEYKPATLVHEKIIGPSDEFVEEMKLAKEAEEATKPSISSPSSPSPAISPPSESEHSVEAAGAYKDLGQEPPADSASTKQNSDLYGEKVIIKVPSISSFRLSLFIVAFIFAVVIVYLIFSR